MGEWAALGPFVGLVKFLSGLRQSRDDRVTAGLAPLSRALAETQLYLRDRERGVGRIQEREDGLVRMWTEAANALRSLDSALADTCYYKSQYWLEPDDWSEGKVQAKGIAIERLIETYAILLKARDVRLDRGIS